ncbi:ring finger protein [Reticulomyxa filosa]|uniref:Ring finger protein n=1 Tax=Reticulomyxa filosa TaxID=46433 RepID=X6LDL3_RETFI|nr:ring finger protein [Reticulomyxa filosa]|eukprot:ETN99435.1 ring finger protein [Reticulomyxa filosa]
MISRHCMIISELEHSWQVLLDQDVLKYDNEFLFGSCFPADRLTTITNYNHLNKIISCMEGGKTVVMYNLENIHESLYDMLNQRYQKRPSGQPYCRVALGSESRDCYVSEKFKLIIIVIKSVAYSPEMPIAFLNRFEKQLISYESSLQPEIRERIPAMRNRLCQAFGVSDDQLSELFPGFCDDTIPSALSCILADEKYEELKIEQYTEPEEEAKTETVDIRDIELKMLKLFRPMCRSEKLIELAIQKKYPSSDDPAQLEHFPALVLFFKKK